MSLPRSFFALLILTAPAWGQKQPFDVLALLKIARISEPQLSPDGKQIAFTVQTVNLDQNTKPKQIYVVPVIGGGPRQLTQQGSANERPQWSPDSKRIAYISDQSGSSQVWIMNADGSEARQITNIATEAGGLLFSPDGKKLVFTSSVYPDCPDDACNKSRLDAEKASKVKAQSYTTLLYRHWTEWQSKRRSHLMVVDAGGGPVKDRAANYFGCMHAKEGEGPFQALSALDERLRASRREVNSARTLLGDYRQLMDTASEHQARLRDFILMHQTYSCASVETFQQDVSKSLQSLDRARAQFAQMQKDTEAQESVKVLDSVL